MHKGHVGRESHSRARSVLGFIPPLKIHQA